MCMDLATRVILNAQATPVFFLICGHHLIIIHLRQTICNRKSKKQYVYFRDICKHIHVFLNPNFKIVQVNIFSIIIFFVTFFSIYSVNFYYERNLTNFLSQLTFQSPFSKMKDTVVIVRICNMPKKLPFFKYYIFVLLYIKKTK